MLLATLLGIAVGLFFGESCKVFAPWGNAYIMILKITILPYLICAIIQGVGQFESGEAKGILKKGAFFIAMAWIINIVMIYFTVFAFPKPKGGQVGSFIAQEPTSINFAELLIPDNIFYALANNIVPAIVIFSLLIGIAFIQLHEKQVIMRSLEIFVDALTRITMWLVKITPLGTFLIIANQVGTVELAVVKQVGSYIALYLLALCVLTFWIFPRLVSSLTSLTAFGWLKDLFPILLLAYTTNTVIVCLPYIIHLLERETQFSEKAQSLNQGIVSVVFNLPFASVFVTVYVFFVSLIYHSALSGIAQIELFLTTYLTSVGAIGMGSWINNLTFLLDSLSLPLDSIPLYIATLPFTSGFQSMLSAMEITSVSLFITLAYHKRLAHGSWKKATTLLVTLLPVVLIYGALIIFRPLPEIETQRKTICDLELRNDVPTTIFTEKPPVEKGVSPDVFDRILRTKTLRVGYNPNIIPFSFCNTHGQLAGYDIAFAYELAHDLGCHLELIPMDHCKVGEELDENLYDIAMSAVSITEDRLKEISFTTPYLKSEIVFVVKDNRRKKFARVADVEKDPHLKIGVLKDTFFEPLAQRLFPDKKIIALENGDAFSSSSADLFLWDEQEAISWVVRNPHYTVIFPKPSLYTDSFGYAVRSDATRLLTFIDQWLELKKNDGFTQKQYDLWILGKREGYIEKAPRWSVLRDILHWKE